MSIDSLRNYIDSRIYKYYAINSIRTDIEFVETTKLGDEFISLITNSFNFITAVNCGLFPNSNISFIKIPNFNREFIIIFDIKYIDININRITEVHNELNNISTRYAESRQKLDNLHQEKKVAIDNYNNQMNHIESAIYQEEENLRLLKFQYN